MFEHEVQCGICGQLAESEKVALDGPAQDDRLCQSCRQAVKNAKEQRVKCVSRTPVTDALREALKDPEKAQQFADGMNAIAAGIRAARGTR